MLALPIFTARHQATIVSVCELNFCVRYGNRWTLTTINTNSHRNGSSPSLYIMLHFHAFPLFGTSARLYLFVSYSIFSIFRRTPYPFKIKAQQSGFDFANDEP